MTDAADVKTDVGLISVTARIPEFWTDQPRLWFIQFEAAVAPQNAGDNTKFQLLIAKLGKQVIQQVADVLETPPAAGKYAAAKERLLAVYEESVSRRIQKLVSDVQLGDQKPSHLLRSMQNLAGKSVNEETLLVLWQNQLPASTRAVLAATSLTEATKLAEVADKVMETSKPIDVASLSNANEVSSLVATIERLNIEVAELRRDYSRPNGSQQKGNFHNRNRTRSRSRSQQARPPDELCYYHYRFGERAEKCRNPCNWEGKRALQGN